jgi:hypothetical protein
MSRKLLPLFGLMLGWEQRFLGRLHPDMQAVELVKIAFYVLRKKM